MIRNYFRMMHITVKKIIEGNTQPTQDVPWTSPEGPNVQDQETLGNQYKNW